MRILLLSLALFGPILIEGSNVNDCNLCDQNGCRPGPCKREVVQKREAGEGKANHNGNRKREAIVKREAFPEHRNLGSDCKCIQGVCKVCPLVWHHNENDCLVVPNCDHHDQPLASPHPNEHPMLGSKCIHKGNGVYERCPTGLPPGVEGKCRHDATCSPNRLGSICVCPEYGENGVCKRCMLTQNKATNCQPDRSCDPPPEPFVLSHHNEYTLGSKCVHKENGVWERCRTGLAPGHVGACKPDLTCKPETVNECVCRSAHCQRCSFSRFGLLTDCHDDPSCPVPLHPPTPEDGLYSIPGATCACHGGACSECRVLAPQYGRPCAAVSNCDRFKHLRGVEKREAGEGAYTCNCNNGNCQECRDGKCRKVPRCVAQPEAIEKRDVEEKIIDTN